MPKPKPKDDSPNVSRDQNYRHSLQPKPTTEGPILRHTQSQNYGARKKKVKTVLPPSIPEIEVTDESKDQVRVDVVNEQVKLAFGEKKVRHSRGSRRSSQASNRMGVDNVAFEMDNGKRGSSVRSSLRDPSVASLTVVREQYCCCTTWTPCERALFGAIGVLAFIILLLVISVVIVSVELGNCTCEKSNNKKAILSIFDLKKY